MFNPRFHKANNVHEAVELANDLKEKGGYDLFRGQIKNWPLKSSFGRQVEKNKKDEALQKMARFERWVKRTKGLEELAKHPDDMIAVAQHYGIPTNFVDFTTSPPVAGFFASYGRIDEENVESCILCLNSQDLITFWKRLPSKYSPPPEILYLEVQNLWRLEAQHGVFLFCPYSNFEQIYDLDRIYFPYTSQISTVKEDEIFPKRKSQLEILLDQYLMNELLIEGQKNIHWGWMRHKIPEIEEKWSKELLLNGTPPPKLSSWNHSHIESWLVQSNEKYLNTLGNETWEMTLDLNKDLSFIRNEAFDHLTTQFKNYPNVRNRLLNWSITVVGDQPRDPIENRVE
ncbi:MAG: FRG domain-containing protein, partial [Proteobacteria bacterium]|nr:FRG domain-containing protein [Pseudomonadota bacterium]